MATTFYNTLTHSIETFAPISSGPDASDPLRGATVRMYTCGPTVYDFAHIGNFKTFLFSDVLRRYMEFRGAKVHQVMNMTDVGHMTDDTAADASGEDKMAIAAKRLKENKKSGKISDDAGINPDDPFAVAQYFVDRFQEDARSLQLRVVQEYDAAPEDQKNNIMPRPTKWIPAFITMIEKLIAAKHAYVGKDGVVYYSVHSFPEYGKLSGNSLEQLSHGAGGRTSETAAKEHPADFFLWKPDVTHIMRWPSPWGEGYPGWHIECSSMATSLLGDSIDIHTGGEDNIFPHHECEIAQSQGATGKQFAKFWLHSRHLMVNGQKMSKSKGTFLTIRDLVAKGYDPLAIRFALIGTRYREQMNFTFQGLQEAASAVTTLRELADKLVASVGGNAVEIAHADDKKMLAEFAKAMDDDLNIAGAIGAVFIWANPLSKQKKFDAPRAASALAALKQVDHVLGVVFPPLQPLPEEKRVKVEALMADRAAARVAKDWAKSDALRNELAAFGVEVKDGPTGSTWRPRLAPVEAPK